MRLLLFAVLAVGAYGQRPYPQGKLFPPEIVLLEALARTEGRDVHMESGETRWLYGDTHSARNLNTHPMEMLFIEVKAANKDR
jgi:hypothetical protein